jgi:hypothetical protein
VRKVFVVVSLAVALLVPAAGRAQQPAPTAVAPADEYFGKLQMSVLGIRNELANLSTRVGSDTSFGKDEIKGAESIEDAFRDWAQKYPRDDWLDRYAVQLEKLYASIETSESRMHLAGFAQWIHEHFAGQPLDADCTDVASEAFGLPGDKAREAAPSPAPSPRT